MAVSATKGGTKTSTYTVGGKTLADIVKDIDAKGPVDPNESKRYSGKCTGRLDLQLTAKDLDVQLSAGKSPVEAVARLKSGSVTTSCAIVMPKLASDKDLSDAAKKEWKRFVEAVGKHETGHADAYFAEAQSLARELDKMTATATGKTEKAAQAAAAKALLEQLKATYGGSVLDDRMKASAKAYDAKTKHGQTQGAVLDGKIA
jgi:predicted secreted Zn-dependent protease